MKSFVTNIRVLFILLTIAALTGCGSEGSTSPDNSISGTASKGPIHGGYVEVYALLADGTKGDLLGTATTTADGAFTIGTGNYSGAALVEVTGGTYIDEATGLVVTNTLMRAAIPDVSGPVSIAVTPLTELAVAYAEEIGGLTVDNINTSNTLVSNTFGGIDVIATEPVDVLSAPKNNDTQDQIDYGLMLAAISQMVSNDSAITDVTQLITLLATDLVTDGTLDETAGDLIAALTDFIASGSNATSVVSLDEMTIDDVVADLAPCTNCKIYVSSSLYTGDLLTAGQALDSTVATGIAAGDLLCMSDANYLGSGDYKALIVDDTNRIASITANAGDGQVDWVLQSNTNYYRMDGVTHLMTTNANALYIWGTLSNTVNDASTTGHMTGLWVDWTTDAFCANWTSSSSSMSATYGYTNQINGNFIGSEALTCGNEGANYNRLLCVEQ